MGNRLHSPPDHPEHELMRTGMAVLILAMVPLVIVGSLMAGASYWVVGPLASLVGVLATRVVWYYFR